jgi:hypothetical protein
MPGPAGCAHAILGFQHIVSHALECMAGLEIPITARLYCMQEAFAYISKSTAESDAPTTEGVINGHNDHVRHIEKRQNNEIFIVE